MPQNNKTKKISLVITTINKPNNVIKKYLKLCKNFDISYVIIGDKKTPLYPKKYPLIDTLKQKKLNFKTNSTLPYNSYSRKNIGYLLAMKNKSMVIVETDDDNYPKKNFFENLDIKKNLVELSGPKWINILKIFDKKKTLIWPRGYPLDLITEKNKIIKKSKSIISPIQQRMCDGNPDVDAIFRLTNKNINYQFKSKNYALNNKSLCPFNSQNTVWHEIAFPLMYLPSYCTMRATDIWRGFVALRIIKNYNWHLTFLESTVVQNRNAHDLLVDFNHEYPVYKGTLKFNEVLNNIKLSDKYEDMLINIYICYTALVKDRMLEKKELNLLSKWLFDIQKIYPFFKKK